MGAFFLNKIDATIDTESVEQVFLKKGFIKSPLKRRLGNWYLFLYEKQLVKTLNYLEDDQGYSVYATGTVVYKAYNYRDSLRQLLNDFKINNIAKDNLLGNFCLLFWNGQTITFLTDILNVHHIFIDKKRSRLSTSFLAILSSNHEKSKINRLAFLEKLTTGYILSPDTLVEDVQQVDEALKKKLSDECHELIWLSELQNRSDDYVFHNRGFNDSLKRQISVLRSYFHQTDNLHAKYHGELGLSSGYDSRLLLASGGCFLSSPLSIHTHSTIGVHDFERKIAEEITQMKKLPLRVIDTEHIENKEPDDIRETLIEGLYFFDARCSYDMGAYSETYTGSYKKRVLGNNRLSFNGLGGEIFRNHYFTSRKYFDTFEWMKYHLYYYYAEEALNNPDLFQQVHSSIISKIENRLSATIRKTMSFFEMRRYYSEIRMPDCDGINHNAQNQIAFYLTPFIEPMISKEALQATPYIGTHGHYQAELIRRIDSSLASLQSHYGFAFDSIPVHHRIYSLVKGYLPDNILNLRQYYLKKKGRGKHLLHNYNTLKSRCNYLKTIESTFIDCFPHVNWQTAMSDSVQKATTIFLASFLDEFSNKLEM